MIINKVTYDVQEEEKNNNLIIIVDDLLKYLINLNLCKEDTSTFVWL